MNLIPSSFSPNKLIFFCLVALIATMTGCVNYIGINSQKKIAPPSQFPSNKSLPQQNGHWPSTHWAEQFGDPQLVLLINEALANNPSLQVAQARIVQARALAENKRSAFFPNVNLYTQAARGRLSATLFPPSSAAEAGIPSVCFFPGSLMK